ncbi:MAG: double-strand break repair helicase AddA [Bauldia sp.]|nr:double-strand break repair helicase AddA [Bauldia sp.]
MSARRRFSDPLTLSRQAEASDPRRSVWVSANAGSGKTYVLARRVVRLLLAGADPARILCLTFTKAAAAEMARRVFDDLVGWVQLDDAALREHIAEMEGRAPDAATLVRARRLFARALETPGGLKFQTVHAFCERLLHQFPFEANVAGHFQVLEETAANVLITESQRAVLSRAAADLQSPLGRALVTVVLAASDRSHEDAVAELVEKRHDLQRWIADAVARRGRSAEPLEVALADLRAVLGVVDGDTRASLEARILSEAALDAAAVARLVPLLVASGGKRDGECAERLAPYLAAADDAARLAAYRGYFTTAAGGVRAPGGLATKWVKDRWPELEAILITECARIEGLFDRIGAAETYESSAAVTRLATSVVEEYQQRKTDRGVLDFEDLIVATLRLLKKTDASRWVHYKIDQGLDHILLDEAQDTSPGQWEVIRALADDFFSGEGAHESIRTLFAVGDEKQSIYSFQGAVPAWFTRVKRDVAARAREAGHAFSDLRLTLSFRSTPDIVGAVDRIFEPFAAHHGLATVPEPPVHQAAREREPGMVVIWPMEPPPAEPEPDDWVEAFDHLGDSAPEMVLARRIASTVADWLVRGERLEAGKPITAGEVLVLVRKRGVLSEAINRALKSAGVPVAGADRLFLSDHIAVKDLLALGEIVLQDRDDLSLAAVLKSPIFGLDEDALFALAYDRPGTLWQALRDVHDAEPFATAWRRLDHLRATVDTAGPYSFFAEVLGPLGARQRFATRLGAEAEDVLDEFLAQALAYERVETPSLQGFIAWMRSTATEIRRETEIGRNEARVMTVHGAKGLEADVVFLVDDGSAPAHSGHDPNFLAITGDPDAAEPAPLVWTAGGKLPASIKAIRDRHRERARQEYRRLLYVGATRARDRLYVCGTLKDQGTDLAGGWHGLVTTALGPTATPAAAIDGTPVLVWRAGPGAAATAAPQPPATGPEPEPPRWLRRQASTARAIRALKPSAAPVDKAVAFAARAGLAARLAGQNEALERGRMIHRLLEALPEQPADIRHATADRYLDAAAPHWPAEMRRRTAAEVLRLFDDPVYAPVFAPGSRAEMDVMAEIETARGLEILSGRIDRVAVTDSAVLIVDYKTNRPAPDRLSAVPETYVAQLALYRLVLRRLYPDRPARAALLWTDRPELMEIPHEMLEVAERKTLGLAVDATQPTRPAA